jgi:Fur family transcriptional regulator, ferric uptake regulator
MTVTAMLPTTTITTSTEQDNPKGSSMVQESVSATRPTRQRLAVAAVLNELDDFRSAQEIHDLLRHAGENVGLTTVYRTLAGLAEGGQVDVLRTPDGESAYRRCSAGHHHHLVCRTCGRTIEIEGPTVERWAQRMAAEHGFTNVQHTVEVFGTCAECS